MAEARRSLPRIRRAAPGSLAFLVACGSAASKGTSGASSGSSSSSEATTSATGSSASGGATTSSAATTSSSGGVGGAAGSSSSTGGAGGAAVSSSSTSGTGGAGTISDGGSDASSDAATDAGLPFKPTAPGWLGAYPQEGRATQVFTAQEYGVGQLSWITQELQTPWGVLPSAASVYTAKAKTGMVLSVGILPPPTQANNAPGSTIGAKGGSFKDGANHVYDAIWTAWAKSMVQLGFNDTPGLIVVFRLGWEFAGNWFPWALSPSASELGPGMSTDPTVNAPLYAKYWQNIVTIIRTYMPDAKFDWNVGAQGGTLSAGGSTTYDPTLAYPGDGYVDYITADCYRNGNKPALTSTYTGDHTFFDTAWTGSPGWASQETSGLNIRNLESFLLWAAAAPGSNVNTKAPAHTQAKPVGFPEYGMGQVDDTYWMQSFVDIATDVLRPTGLTTNNVAYVNYFESTGAQPQLPGPEGQPAGWELFTYGDWWILDPGQRAGGSTITLAPATDQAEGLPNTPDAGWYSVPVNEAATFVLSTGAGVVTIKATYDGSGSFAVSDWQGLAPGTYLGAIRLANVDPVSGASGTYIPAGQADTDPFANSASVWLKAAAAGP